MVLFVFLSCTSAVMCCLGWLFFNVSLNHDCIDQQEGCRGKWRWWSWMNTTLAHLGLLRVSDHAINSSTVAQRLGMSAIARFISDGCRGATVRLPTFYYGR